MRLLDWLLGRDEENDGSHAGGDQPPPSWAGAGPDIDEGKTMTQTERDIRRVQSQYDPETDSFNDNKGQ